MRAQEDFGTSAPRLLLRRAQTATIEAAWLHLSPPEGSEAPPGELLVSMSASMALLSEDDFEES